MKLRPAAVACLVTLLLATGCTSRTAGTAAPAAPLPAPTTVATADPMTTAPPDAGASTEAPLEPTEPTAEQPTEPPPEPATQQSSEPATDSPDSPPAAEPAVPAGPDPGVAAGSLPDVGLDGVNDASCVPDPAVGPPVLLVHGTFSTASSNFGTIAPDLVADGRCVYAVDYGGEGMAPVADSAAEVAAFAHGVLALTGAEQLDVVGFSQGGLVIRTALRENGLADAVRVAALVAPTFHGTDSPLVAELVGESCPSCGDQVVGSALLERLNAGGDLDGAVRYAVVSTSNDEYVTPVASQVPDGPADRVVAVVVEELCPDVQTDHIAIVGLPGVASWVLDALRTGGEPDPAALTCG